jgi:hypothetical protein
MQYKNPVGDLMPPSRVNPLPTIHEPEPLSLGTQVYTSLQIRTGIPFQVLPAPESIDFKDEKYERVVRLPKAR